MTKTSNKTFKVGQILYVIPSNKTSVVPIQIIEEITKRSINGQTTSYIVRYSIEEDKTCDIEQVSGEIFDSADKVKVTLIERSTTALNKLVDNAVQRAHEWYGPQLTPKGDDDDIVVEPGIREPGVARVRMPDGEIVKVSMD